MWLPLSILVVAGLLPYVLGHSLLDFDIASDLLNNDLNHPSLSKPKRPLYVLILNGGKHTLNGKEIDKLYPETSDGSLGETKKSENNEEYLTKLGKGILRQKCSEEIVSELDEDLKNTIVLEQHYKRMSELNKFMKDRLASTKFLHDEMKRALKNNGALDEVRKMVKYLDKREHKAIKEKVLKYYHELLKPKHKDVWRHKVNKITHHIVNDPYNDVIY